MTCGPRWRGFAATFSPGKAAAPAILEFARQFGRSRRDGQAIVVGDEVELDLKRQGGGEVGGVEGAKFRRDLHRPVANIAREID